MRWIVQRKNSIVKIGLAVHAANKTSVARAPTPALLEQAKMLMSEETA